MFVSRGTHLEVPDGVRQVSVGAKADTVRNSKGQEPAENQRLVAFNATGLNEPWGG